ncbi:hypothetical protein CHS0354_034796 [Potamilus streckersoni]|uniref:Uncharacterized protein n=1 Tax=Potamilus streckersoni TaxID=2493646 RepID=A0AAE0VID0_9BIVA|nr:hypothetical protein CHS0354_034796 [Potamilus streckersoni]
MWSVHVVYRDHWGFLGSGSINDDHWCFLGSGSINDDHWGFLGSGSINAVVKAVKSGYRNRQ